SESPVGHYGQPSRHPTPSAPSRALGTLSWRSHSDRFGLSPRTFTQNSHPGLLLRALTQSCCRSSSLTVPSATASKNAGALSGSSSTVDPMPPGAYPMSAIGG